MWKIIVTLALCTLCSHKIDATPGLFSNIFNRPPTFIPIGSPIFPNPFPKPNNPTNPSSGSSSSCSCPAGQSFISQAVTQHNCYRTQHHAPGLTEDSSLDAAAQAYANTLAADIRSQGTAGFKHSPQGIAGNYGENLALMPGCSINGCAAVDAWYNEINSYSFSNPGFSAATGHFTALVWKDTSRVGIGSATTSVNGNCYTVVVANYLSPGNVQSQFTTNVLQK